MASGGERLVNIVIEPQPDGDDQDVDNCGAELVVPKVVVEAKPYIGQEFEDEASARLFYNEYAKLAGFSIRMNQSRTLTSSDQIVWRRIVCSCEGKRPRSKFDNEQPPNNPRVRRKRVSARCGCLARMEISSKNGNIWTVSRFVEEHTHDMAIPTQVQFLRSHHVVDSNTKRMLKKCNKVGIGPSAAYNLVSELEGGDDVNFTRLDVKNTMSRTRRRSMRLDVEQMIKYLQQKHDKDPRYYFSVRKNPDGTLLSLFWADKRSRLDFKAFRDVICFDTTYKTNKYMMPFAPFVGLNHHKQTVVFGCGLITNENADSFLWLFDNFKDAMGGDSPVAIITNQDQAIQAALEQVFPNAIHKYFLWHIMKKVPEKLNKWYRDYGDFRRDFNEVVYNDVCPEDFDAKWDRFLQLYDLTHHEWLVELYNQRHKWVPIYHKSTRFYGMCTNQRSEGFHSLMDQYTCQKTTLLEFVEQVERALISIRKDELEADKRTAEAMLVRRTSFSIERFLFEAYTNVNFMDAQEELWHSNAYFVALVGDDEEEMVYDVMSCYDKFDTRVVVYSVAKNYGRCSCMLFESTGIVCRHLYAVFWKLDIIEMPLFFVAQRMLRDPRHGLHINASPCGDHSTSRLEDLIAVWNSINAVTSGRKKLLEHAIAGSNKLLNELKDLDMIFEEDEHLGGGELGKKGETFNHGGDLMHCERVKNPKVIASRGHPKKAKKKVH